MICIEKGTKNAFFSRNEHFFNKKRGNLKK